jgi:putative OPT family oligopeptide transporter
MSGPAASTAAAPTDAPADFKPYVPASEERKELTVRALVIGSLLGIVFGASTVYLGLKVGLTVSASIPIAVLSIPIFRALGKGSILENNITQTVGSAGESIAAGAAFTLPALLVMGYDLDIVRSSLVALTGGWLGVLLMVPLRRSLIVKEHGTLPYPEGTACAEVLIAGEKKGVHAKLVFIGLILGGVYKSLYKVLGLWREAPTLLFGKPVKNAMIGVEASPELMGVGYIIGPRIAGTMLSGGMLASMIFVPAIYFVATQLNVPEFVSGSMSAGAVRSKYVFYIAVGAVAAGGLISLGRAIPVIVRTFAAAMRSLRKSGVGATQGAVPRTEVDLPITVTLGGSVVIALALSILPTLHVNPIASLCIVVFGFVFATVSSRICGQIGSSSNPISGMTIATLLLTSGLFTVVGWTGTDYRPVALTVGAIVCVAAANAGATSQDLKTGFLLGATPKRQQVGLMVGVTASAAIVGLTLYFINLSYTTIEPLSTPTIELPGEGAKPEELARVTTVSLPDGSQGKRLETPGHAKSGGLPGAVVVDAERRVKQWSVKKEAIPADAPTVKGKDGKDYKLVRYAGDPAYGVPGGKILVDDSGVAHFGESPGVSVGGGSTIFTNEHEEKKFSAPKAQLMALIVDGILQRKLEWGLVLLGVFLAICLELAGVEALPFAVGMYLPIQTSAPIFAGGILRWIAGKISKKRGGSAEEGDTGRGVLLSSGLIAGSALCGLLAGIVVLVHGSEFSLPEHIGWELKPWAGDVVSLLAFCGLGAYVLWTAVGGRSKREVGKLGE